MERLRIQPIGEGFQSARLLPMTNLYILGPAKLREEVAQPMIAQSKDARYYFISTKSESQIIRSKNVWSFIIILFSFVAALVVPVVVISVETGVEPQEAMLENPGWIFVSGLIFLAVASLFYLTILYNGLIRVRNRLIHAMGLIEIQLKRRHDLIPSLLKCVKGIASYETEVQELVASYRSLGANGTSRDSRRGGLRESIKGQVWLAACLFCLKITLI